MTETQVWLAQSAYERLRAELMDLLRQRTEGLSGDVAEQFVGDSADHNTDQQLLTARRERENRIRRLQELLQNPLLGQDPPDDGVAEPGMVLTIRYEVDQESETFLLAHTEDGAYPADLMTCSPDSPLGVALTGRKQGEKVRYTLPNGETMEVTVLRAVPYRPEAWYTTTQVAG
ncbi:GreA/GreB family elongation factor [Pseudonocardia sp. RS11V-5]|uniref:GreA/GreB family elongation factor n=1 Tax=Pseudonocardia terrae TaxID=2905831 RepID=UPI001E655289|nr:GreA/GreB family elongation factor [Pseudonocardia terrae]MCE3556528.1 GreA/GreB family elongation factor [Pseudonocardia terrae]